MWCLLDRIWGYGCKSNAIFITRNLPFNMFHNLNYLLFSHTITKKYFTVYLLPNSKNVYPQSWRFCIHLYQTGFLQTKHRKKYYVYHLFRWHPFLHCLFYALTLKNQETLVNKLARSHSVNSAKLWSNYVFFIKTIPYVISINDNENFYDIIIYVSSSFLILDISSTPRNFP